MRTHPTHHNRTLVTFAVGALVVFSAACGNSNDKTAGPGDAERTVKVEMADIAFNPATLAVAKGEAVRFVFENNGKTEHEAFLGTPAEQRNHEKKMTGGSKGGHDMGDMGGMKLLSPSTPEKPVSSPPASMTLAPSRSAATNPATTPPA